MELSKSLCDEVALVALSFITICLYPLLALVLLPLFIHRWIIAQLTKRDPKLGSMLGGLDSIFAACNTYTKPAAVLIPYLSTSSKVDQNHIIKVFNERIFKPKDGLCVYPELKQKIVRRYGYHFWHQVPQFTIENHVTFLNPSNPNHLVRKSELPAIISDDLTWRPFDSSRSPWELILIPNYHDESNPQVKSLLLFRLHHCLFDGHSFINFWQKLSLQPWKDLGGNAKSFRPSFLQLFIQYLRIILTGPYYFLKMVHFSTDTNKFYTKYRNHPTGKILLKETLFSLDTLKNVKNQLKVNLSSVVIAILAEGVKETMKKKNSLKENASMKIHTTMPWPLPGHPDRLKNHWSVIKLPVTVDKNDLVKTLRRINKEYESMRHSIVPLVGPCLFRILGSLPVGMIPEAKSLVTSTCMLSSFPAPSQKVDIFGYEIVDVRLAGTPPDGHGIMAAAISYDRNIYFTSGGDTCNLASEEDAEFLKKSIKQAVHQLQNVGEMERLYNYKKTQVYKSD